jgi:hypothetical protein
VRCVGLFQSTICRERCIYVSMYQSTIRNSPAVNMRDRTLSSISWFTKSQRWLRTTATAEAAVHVPRLCCQLFCTSSPVFVSRTLTIIWHISQAFCFPVGNTAVVQRCFDTPYYPQTLPESTQNEQTRCNAI